MSSNPNRCGNGRFDLAAVWSGQRIFLCRAVGAYTHAVVGLLAVALALGLTRYAQAAIIDKLNAAGFATERAPANIGHNQKRRTYYARPN